MAGGIALSAGLGVLGYKTVTTSGNDEWSPLHVRNETEEPVTIAFTVIPVASDGAVVNERFELDTFSERTFEIERDRRYDFEVDIYAESDIVHEKRQDVYVPRFERSYVKVSVTEDSRDAPSITIGTVYA